MAEGGDETKPIGEALVLGTVQDGHSVGALAKGHACKRAQANSRTAARVAALPCSIENRRRIFL
eukprot:7313120-Alexandrium_andersonii.AAC.1